MQNPEKSELRIKNVELGGRPPGLKFPRASARKRALYMAAHMGCGIHHCCQRQQFRWLDRANFARTEGENFAFHRAPGFEYELALAFLRRGGPGSITFFCLAPGGMLLAQLHTPAIICRPPRTLNFRGLCPPEFLTAAAGSNFAGSAEPISPGVSRISLEPQARISLYSELPASSTSWRSPFYAEAGRALSRFLFGTEGFRRCRGSTPSLRLYRPPGSKLALLMQR